MQPPLTTEPAVGGPLVRVTCRLDADGSEPLAQEIDRLLRAGEHVVRLDLAAVTFVSSAGIGALGAAHRKLRSAGGRLEVVTASPQVLAVLRLTRLDTLIGPHAPAAPAASPDPATKPPATTERVVGSVRLVALTPPTGPAAAVRVVPRGAAAAALDLSPATFALGLGTPDVDDPRPLAHAGEAVAAAGCLFHRPPAADPRIDWVVPHAGHAARFALVEGLAWDAAAAGSAGFEPATVDGTVTLDDLARGMLAASGGQAVAFAAVGEIHGLVGAELVRPLAEATSVDHPRAGAAAVTARWLSFSREPVHARRTALVVGVAASTPPADPALAAAVRPLDPAGDADLVGHAHAAVFAFRPIRREPGDPAQVVTALASAPPLAVMHLLADPAPLVGSGTSELVRGVAWFWPLAAAGGGA
ncbi:MAG: STAS domain-containing protein [Planctomycetaceae bacterium]